MPSGQDVTIEVTNDDDVEHSFTLDDDSVSQDVEGGETQTVTLNLTEEIGWHCEYHPDDEGDHHRLVARGLRAHRGSGRSRFQCRTSEQSHLPSPRGARMKYVIVR